MLKIGDYVTRKKYGNDILFKIDKIENNTIYLKGVDVRLYADSEKDDLILSTISKKKEDFEALRQLNIKDFFYIPGTILHLDSDQEYIDKCNKYYKSQKVMAYSYKFTEKDFKNNVNNLLKKHNPNILVITGHDAYYKRRKNNDNYKNSRFFIDTVKEVRKIKNENELLIVAGACQSDFISLIKSGATFASSPNHVNIHALDPAIIASGLALTDKNEEIDLEELINKTKYKSDGIGGIKTKGMMITAYPRKEQNEYK